MNNNFGMEETISEYGNRGREKGWPYFQQCSFRERKREVSRLGVGGEKERVKMRERRSKEGNVNPYMPKRLVYDFLLFYMLTFFFHNENIL